MSEEPPKKPGCSSQSNSFADSAVCSCGDLQQDSSAGPQPGSSDGSSDDLPSKRPRKRMRDNVQCPICGLTLRENQVRQHYEAEVRQMKNERQKVYKGKKRARPDARRGTDEGFEEEKTPFERASKVLSDARKHRLVWKCGNPIQWAGLGGVVSDRVCPLCSCVVGGSQLGFVQHVQRCIESSERHSTNNDEDDEDGEIDVGSYDEDNDEVDSYEWCGQTRVRVSSMLPPSALPDHVVVASPDARDDDDTIDVEGDDSQGGDFGPPQYSEADLIPCRGDEEEPPAFRDWPAAPQQRTLPLPPAPMMMPSSVVVDVSPGSRKVVGKGKAPLRSADLEPRSLAPQQQASPQTRCSICMDVFKIPLVSVKCWHVFCEECWHRSLGAQRLCAKCKLITSPEDLRRIYI